MKKASRNLMLRSETLRTLGDMDLSRVAGGNYSNAAPCAAVIVYQSGDKQSCGLFADQTGAAQRPLTLG